MQSGMHARMNATYPGKSGSKRNPLLLFYPLLSSPLLSSLLVYELRKLKEGRWPCLWLSWAPSGSPPGHVGAISEPSWSPFGAQIAFARYSLIWRMRLHASSGPLGAILNHLGAILVPSWGLCWPRRVCQMRPQGHACAMRAASYAHIWAKIALARYSLIWRMDF